MAALAARTGGDGGPVLLLLHGLGAHGGAWTPMLDSAAANWPGRWIAPDLLGHGASPWAERYGGHDHAAALAALMRDQDAADDVVVLGHSMGGSVGLSLASGRHGFTPRRVLGFGIKYDWTAEDLAGLERLAASPPKILPTRNEAVVRFLKVSGLIGLVDPGSSIAAAGVVEDVGGWRLAADPAAATIGPPAMDELVAAAACPVSLAAGERDLMSAVEGLRRWDADAVAFPGLGHNAMVEDPAAVWEWARRMIAQT